ncbi:MAG: lipid II:glycine glycyltransferase FemX [Sporichthyaceae bacterium]
MLHPASDPHTLLVPAVDRAAPPDLRVLPIGVEAHRAYLARTASAVSFLQCPAWAAVKEGWSAEHLGWVDHRGDLVGAALVLYRRMPHTRRSFAYLPEGPVIDWTDPCLARWLQPLGRHLRARGAFAVRIGPPLPARVWQAKTIHSACTDGQSRRLGDVPPDAVPPLTQAVAGRLAAMGWRRGDLQITGRGDVQPPSVFEVPLLGNSQSAIWSGLSSQWRRNVAKAQRSGVEIRLGGYDDLPTFHRLLLETQTRDGFDLGRSLAYFQRQFSALAAEHPDRIRLYLAVWEGEVLAAHTMIVVGRRAWYLNGASASHRREVRPSHALQWRMMCDAQALGATVYDMRGFDDSLDRTDRAHGLLRWKLGTGGQAVEYLGEWDLPLSRPTYLAAKCYLAWRSRR